MTLRPRPRNLYTALHTFASRVILTRSFEVFHLSRSLDVVGLNSYRVWQCASVLRSEHLPTKLVILRNCSTKLAKITRNLAIFKQSFNSIQPATLDLRLQILLYNFVTTVEQYDIVSLAQPEELHESFRSARTVCTMSASNVMSLLWSSQAQS